jgi:hypothetical protein
MTRQTTRLAFLLVALSMRVSAGWGSEATLRRSAADTSVHDDERYGIVIVKDRADVHTLTRIVSIANVKRDSVFVFASSGEWHALRERGFTLIDLPYPGIDQECAMSTSPARDSAWNTYPTYAGYLAMMAYYAESFPTICRLDTIGYSVLGRLILVLKISSNVLVHQDKPEVLYTSTMHGNEPVGFVLLLRLADYLLTQYGENTPEGLRVTRLVENSEIWVNPLFNPDGTYRLGGDTTVANARRRNAHGIDLNRNFPDRVFDPVNTGSGREPETQAMMRFVAAHNFSLSANFHSGVQVVNYPWDNGTPSGTYSICPDDDWFIRLSRTYADLNPDIMNGGFPNGITNGCEWYEVIGGRQDWIYFWHGGRETTIELTNSYLASGSSLPQHWVNNKESFLAYLEESLRGIRGVVLDDSSWMPVGARIDVLQVPGAPVFTDSTVGDYHRLLLPGVYDIVVSAAGYVPDTVLAVVVVDSGATRVDVPLRRAATAVTREPVTEPAGFVLEQNFPNPCNPATVIRYTIAAGRRYGAGNLEVRLVVYDLLGREVAVLVNEKKAPGDYEVKFDASALSSGVYFYRLTVGQYAECRRMVLVR